MGTTTVNGNLSLNNTSNLFFELSGTSQTVGGGVNDLVQVNGNLTLDGVLNVAGTPPVFTFLGPKTWRLFNYTGTLTNNGLSFGSMPSVFTPDSDTLYWVLDLNTNGQVNLTAVPEPGTFCLLGAIGLIGIVAVRRRKAKLAA